MRTTGLEPKLISYALVGGMPIRCPLADVY